MAQHGSIDKVSVRAVAAATGVSPTAVYRHFDNHMDLLWEAVQYSFDEFGAVMHAADAASTDIYQRLRACGEAYMRFAFEQRGKYRVMFSNRVELPPRAEPPGTDTFQHLIGLVTAILTDRGDDRDPHFVSVQVWTWLHGIVDLMGNHSELPWPDPALLLDELAERLDLVAR